MLYHIHSTSTGKAIYSNELNILPSELAEYTNCKISTEEFNKDKLKITPDRGLTMFKKSFRINWNKLFSNGRKK